MILDSWISAQEALRKLPSRTLQALLSEDFSSFDEREDAYTNELGYCVIGLIGAITLCHMGWTPERLSPDFIRKFDLSLSDQSNFAALMEYNDKGMLSNSVLNQLVEPILIAKRVSLSDL